MFSVLKLITHLDDNQVIWVSYSEFNTEQLG